MEQEFQGGKRDSREGTGIHGALAARTGAGRKYRQALSTSSLKNPALPSPGSCGAAAGPHCAAEPRGGKGRQENSWKQLETAGAARGVGAAAALLRPASSEGCGDTGTRGWGHCEAARGMFQDFLESWRGCWEENPALPRSEGRAGALGLLWDLQEGWTGLGSKFGDAPRDSKRSPDVAQLCWGTLPG